jgi:hypothetical protein
MGPSLTNALTVTTAIGGRTSLCTPRQVRVPVGALSQAMRAMRQNGSAVIGVQRHSHVQSAPAPFRSAEQATDSVAPTEAKTRRRNRTKQV